MILDELPFDMPPVERPVFHDNTIFHVGVSGGKDSVAALLWMVHESGIEKKKIVATFCDIGNDHQWTSEHVRRISETVHPIETIKPEMDFFELAMHKKRFPSTKARFCTQHLKIYPTQGHIQKLRFAGLDPIAVSGVRADESEARKSLLEWDYNGYLLCFSWRPLIAWTIEDVFAIHKKYGVPLNPLYSAGAKRVGCWPCIMSRKSEIRNIALNFPERIDHIRSEEQKHLAINGRYSSFFPPNATPPGFHDRQHGGSSYASIDAVVKWSLTGKRAKGSWEDDEPEEKLSCQSGFCE